MKNKKQILIDEIKSMILAVSKITLKKHNAFTFKETIIDLSELFKLKVNNSEMSVTLENGFLINMGWFEDEISADKTRHCFAVLCYPFGNESEIYVYFDQNKKAHFEDQYGKHEDLFSQLEIREGKEMTYNQALDLLSKIGEKESQEA